MARLCYDHLRRSVLLTIATIIRFDPLILVLCLGAIVGGIPFAGSNRSTLLQVKSEILAKEALRAELIDDLRLKAVQTT